VAGLLAGVINKGTTTRDATEIAAAIEGVGGTLSGSSFNEFTGVFASGPSTSADLIFDLLADVTLHPTFPQDQFELVRNQTLADMEQASRNPNTLASRQFNRIAYPDHPYSFYPTPATVNEITPEDLAAFHQDYYKPNNALLVIVGDLTEETARAQAERVFEGWQPGETPVLFDYPPLQEGDTSQIYLIDRPDAEQSTLRVGNRALDARSEDRYALTLGNIALGGSGLASRLSRNLREDKGYTYGVSSGLTTQNDTGAFLVASDVGVAVTGDALREILHELSQIRDTGVLTDELAEAKGMRIGQFTMSIADPASLSSELAVRHLYGVPLTEIESYVSTIEGVTANEVLSAAREYIEVQDPIIVVVGDAAQVKPQLQTLGTVAVVDASGNIVEVAEAITPPPTSGTTEPSEEEADASDCVCQEDATGEEETTEE
jgi:zinc protease